MGRLHKTKVYKTKFLPTRLAARVRWLRLSISAAIKLLPLALTSTHSRIVALEVMEQL